MIDTLGIAGTARLRPNVIELLGPIYAKIAVEDSVLLWPLGKWWVKLMLPKRGLPRRSKPSLALTHMDYGVMCFIHDETLTAATFSAPRMIRPTNEIPVETTMELDRAIGIALAIIDQIAGIVDVWSTWKFNRVDLCRPIKFPFPDLDPVLRLVRHRISSKPPRCEKNGIYFGDADKVISFYDKAVEMEHEPSLVTRCEIRLKSRKVLAQTGTQGLVLPGLRLDFARAAEVFSQILAQFPRAQARLASLPSRAVMAAKSAIELARCGSNFDIIAFNSNSYTHSKSRTRVRSEVQKAMAELLGNEFNLVDLIDWSGVEGRASPAVVPQRPE